jgi:hypothetical protein
MKTIAIIMRQPIYWKPVNAKRKNKPNSTFYTYEFKTKKDLGKKIKIKYKTGEKHEKTKQKTKPPQAKSKPPQEKLLL